VITVTTRGTEKLGRLAAAIRQAGDRDLQKELAKGLRRAIRPMQKEFRRGALGFLPYRGGLAEEVSASMRFSSKVSLGRNPSVRIIASLPGHDLAAMERGRLRHPVHGNRKNWVRQNIRPNWFSDTGTLAAQDAYDELEKAMDELARKLEARV